MKPSAYISSFSKKELDSFFKQAICLKKNQAFTILKAQSPLDFGRILIIASRKYGNAIERNLLRRRCKSIFLQHKLFEHKQDIIMIARPAGQNYEFNNLEQLILAIFKK